MTSPQDTPVTLVTIGLITFIVGLLAVSGVKVYAWIRAQVKAERSEWEASYDKQLQEVKEENRALRVEMTQMKQEIHDLTNGKSRALQHLGRALGADTIETAKRMIDSAISALAPSS